MQSHADPLAERKQTGFFPPVSFEMLKFVCCRDVEISKLKLTVLICQMMQLYRRGWKKRTVTSDLKIDGKKEITAQKERLLTCKEKGLGGGVASAVPSQLCGVCSVHVFICRYQSCLRLDSGSWGFSLLSQGLSGFQREERQLFSF